MRKYSHLFLPMKQSRAVRYEFCFQFVSHKRLKEENDGTLWKESAEIR
jgi:hypothetical protein